MPVIGPTLKRVESQGVLKWLESTQDSHTSKVTVCSSPQSCSCRKSDVFLWIAVGW